MAAIPIYNLDHPQADAVNYQVVVRDTMHHGHPNLSNIGSRTPPNSLNVGLCLNLCLNQEDVHTTHAMPLEGAEKEKLQIHILQHCAGNLQRLTENESPSKNVVDDPHEQ